MAYGLRTWNAAGALQVDTTTRMARVMSTWSLYNPTLSNDLFGPLAPYDSPVVPGLVNDGTWAVWCPGHAHRFQFIGNNQIRIWFYNAYVDDLAVQVTFLKW